MRALIPAVTGSSHPVLVCSTDTGLCRRCLLLLRLQGWPRLAGPRRRLRPCGDAWANLRHATRRTLQAGGHGPGVLWKAILLDGPGPIPNLNRARRRKASRTVAASSFASTPKASLSFKPCRLLWIASLSPPLAEMEGGARLKWRTLLPLPMADARASAASSEANTVTYVVTIEVPVEAAHAIAGVLEAAETPAAIAVTLFERGCGRVEVSAHYAEAPARDQLTELIQATPNPQELGALRIEPLADRDWVALAEGLRRPVRAGRFLVHGRHDRAKVGHGRFALEIDAGVAFGTAHHASTRGCLLALDRLLKTYRPKAVLDIGTGTGILAIAAARTLAPRASDIVASDADARAVATAMANARKNGAAPQLRVLQASGFAHPLLRRMQADLLFANLAPPALLELAGCFARHMGPNGIAVLSGIEQAQAGTVEARYRAAGFILKSRILLDGWATLMLTRGSPRALRD